jgi:hypothetical protein
LTPATFGQNTFERNADNGNGRFLLTNDANWSDSVLPDVTQGVIGAGTDGSLTSATGWDVIQNGSTVGISGAGSTLTLNDSTWVINGGALGDINTNINNSTVNVNSSGTLSAGSGRDLLVSGTSIVTVDGGLITAGDQLWIRDTATLQGNGIINVGRLEVSGTGHLDISNSTVTVTGDFGQRATNTGGGAVTLAGTTLTAGSLKVDTSGLSLTFSGAAAGSATFGDWGPNDVGDDDISLNFLAGTGMSMTMTAARALTIVGNFAADEWAEALWSNDQLLYAGESGTDLGLDWAAVSSTGFADGSRFNFDGRTLDVSVIPEPGSFALLAGMLGLTSVMLRRRRS